MSSPGIQRPDLPETMTWEELEQLPEEIAEQIELWDGRVVWRERGPAEHQEFTNLLWSGLRRCLREAVVTDPQQCWNVHTRTDVFFDASEKSDFMTPDILICRNSRGPYQDVRADDVLLVGEVLSPNPQTDLAASKARYAKAGITWYWEVALERERSSIEIVRAFALETTHGELPQGTRPLYPANYLLIDKWSPKDSDAIEIDFPFPIHIPWSELAF
ncbi:Uma2 family endonuclease [Nocardia sp. NPDC051787]|uniref:Uma2 family endonuclease n=1 Tax=Nocardia sp. NPDC051787 TaxID=3155415 RepID=UPI00342CC2AF